MILKKWYSRILVRAWNSPTLMTWGSRLARALNIFWVLPLIVTSFSQEEIKLWYSFAAFWGLIGIADLGFNNTFIRFLSFSLVTKAKQTIPNNSTYNFCIEEIIPVMKRVYLWLTILFSFGVFCTFFVFDDNIYNTPTPDKSLGAFIVIAIGAIVFIYGNFFISFLLGINKVAIVMRWDALSNIASVFTSITVLSQGGGIFELAISQQAWVLFNVLRNFWLSYQNDSFKNYIKAPFKANLLKQAFNKAWKSGLGVFMIYGLGQVLAIYYSLVSNTTLGAAYLLTLNILRQVDVFAQAPFYSKLPLFSQLRAKGDLIQVIKKAQWSMKWSHSVLLLGFLGLSLFGNVLLELLNSKIQLVTEPVFFVMCLGLLFERFGAMHIQIYTTTNKIIWHIANGITGIITICSVLLLFPKLDVIALPLSILIGNAGFYSWYSAMHSYNSLKTNLLQFELKVWPIPITFFILFCTSSYLSYYYPEVLKNYVQSIIQLFG